nr:hypothetical protein [Microbacterium sp. NIBRBAC000506063]
MTRFCRLAATVIQSPVRMSRRMLEVSGRGSRMRVSMARSGPRAVSGSS